jgi:hypothetical protein
MISKYNIQIKEEQMRDILNILDTLNEVSLAPGEITKYEDRFETFINHIVNGRPFYTDKDKTGIPKGTKVILDPNEAKRFVDLYANNQFVGRVTAKDTTGKIWPLSDFAKTIDFGGATAKPDDSPETLSKEAAGLKPDQIGITDQPIKAGQLGQVIISNPSLNSTPHGKAVIACAQAIMAGQTPIIPPEILKSGPVTAAIVDYAGEYLGVLALINGRTNFPNQSEFLKWLGGNLGNLTLNFPSEQNNPMADSFAEITNPTTNHQINISSKGTGGGAAPAMSGLHIPEHLKKKKAYRTAIDLIELTQNENLPTPTTISQVFQAMNLLNERIPQSIPAVFKPFLPWPQSIINEINASRLAKKGQRVDLPKYKTITDQVNSTGSDGGKLTYVTKKAVIDIVNSGAVPEFQAAVLEILDYNFIQQYTNLVKKTGALAFSTQWPAKLNGRVTMESKSSATEPTAGGFSFKLSPTGAMEENAPPVYLGTEKTLGRKRQR